MLKVVGANWIRLPSWFEVLASARPTQ